MTDLLKILPSFPTGLFSALLPVVEQHALSTTDLLTQHPVDLAKQTRIPLLDLKRFVAAVQASLADDLTPEKPLAPKPIPTGAEEENKGRDGEDEEGATAATPTEEVPAAAAALSAAHTPCISTLDETLDAALGGGVPVGYVTEFAGESGTGKTQFLLSLCLAVQLPPPRGLGRQALYVSTEAALATRRLAQMLPAATALQLAAADDDDAAPAPAPTPPSLDNILSAATPDLESQDHILEYQVPVLLARHDVGLLVLDSVAANYRAEFESGSGGALGSSMAARSAQLVRLGAHLRDLARRHGIAVVVANQVADRFASSGQSQGRANTTARLPHRGSMAPPPESPLASRGSRQQPPPSTNLLQATPTSSMPMPTPDDGGPPAPPTLLLDHQQRWFTGWGDEPRSSHALKTPSLGLVWSTQIACRVALFKRPVYGRPRRVAAPLDARNDCDDDGGADREPTLKSWRRWMKVVFAPHVAASGQGIADAAEFEITTGGLRGVVKDVGKTKG
ncbi:DNA repair protein rhp57 [Cordyceps fumosorosea ARSEF 2679]|uniref:DNA repair protein rhp57 n=1 Tax=Cordyceps fumosorosea (strain ARSEF 2679) TaxID=1081104 RepID=A0A167S509_CORFA|nr:DNA repair protein rhp57 [Cordyceps fumosorosea ARSEF 2679]OAA59255.1 DNA repair protein rhp57 [Cordyceps fumosorosea ARSEF 2679]